MPIVGNSRREPVIAAKELEGSGRRNEFQDRGGGDLARILVGAERLARGKVADNARQRAPLHARQAEEAGNLGRHLRKRLEAERQEGDEEKA